MSLNDIGQEFNLPRYFPIYLDHSSDPQYIYTHTHIVTRDYNQAQSCILNLDIAICNNLYFFFYYYSDFEYARFYLT